MNNQMLRLRNRFDLLRLSRRILPAWLLAMFLLSTSLMMAAPVWAQSGTFGPYNEMVIIYNVSGATLDPKPREIDDFTRSRIYTGQLTGRELRVSGTAEFSYDPIMINVVATVDGVDKKQEFEFPMGERGRSQSFDVSVPIPKGATSGSFSISIRLSSPSGARTLVVSGDLTGPGPGASGGSRLGTVAVVGGLAGAAVIGGLAVLGGAVAAGVVGVKVLGGGGGAAAASATAGGTNGGVEMSDQVVADVVESLNEDLELSDKPPAITREQLEIEIQKELDRLAEEGHFIGNKTHIQKVFNLLPPVYIYDWLWGSTNNYCGEMWEKGNAHLNEITPKGTIIEDISMDHDGFYKHIANKVILPDGTELVVDYWEGLKNGKPAIYTVDEWLKKWQKILGKKRENTHHPFPTIGPRYDQEITPRYSKYNENKLISEGQIAVIEFILKNGTQETTHSVTKIRPPEQREFEHFTTNSVLPEQLEALKNWGKTLDEEAIATHVDYILNSKKYEARRIWKEKNLTRRGIKGTKSWHLN